MITSIFSSPKPSSFFSFLDSKDTAYANRVREVGRRYFELFLILNVTVISMAALIYLIHGSVTLGAALFASGLLTTIIDLWARISVSWNLD